MKHLLFVCFLTTIIKCFGQYEKGNEQEIIVPINNELTELFYPTIHQLSFLDTIEKVQIKDSTYLYNCIVRGLHLQPSQFWYHEFKNNRGSEESFNRIRERLKAFNGINSSDLINGNIKECLRFLIGVDKNDNIVLVADTSNDESFVDDPSVIIGRISYIPKAVRYCNFHFNKIELNARGDKIQTGFSVTVRIKPIVYANRQALVESLMGYNDDIALIQNSYKIGDIIVDNERYRIIINSNISRTIWEEINKSQLFFARQGVPVSKETLYKKLGDGDFYAVGDTLLLNGKFLTIEKISPYQDTITFLRVKGEDAFGIHDGFVIQDFSAEQINGEEFNLETIDRSYLILDFWGSWCEPCIKLLPKQKKIYKYFSKSLKGKINFISVAYDQRANMDKLKNYIVKFEMNWIHLFDDRENHGANYNSLVKRLKIGCYPTFILIDPSRKILFRGCGEDALDHIKEILSRAN